MNSKEEISEDWDWVARLLHFSDSALPVGAYAHSFGLEGVCQMGVVTGIDSLEMFLKRDVAQALCSIDLPLVAKSHAAMMDGRLAELERLDQLSWALRPTRQLRDAASKIGRQQRLVYERTWAQAEMLDLKYQQSPVVMGVTYALEGVPLVPALWSMTYQTYSMLLQASLKLVPIGPAATQSILQAVMASMSSKIDVARELSEEEIGSFNPVWDIGAAQHETAPARLFIS